MTSPNESEKEKILNRIYYLKEEIWETRSYISSDFCRRCSEMYDKIIVLEQELKGLQRKLEKDERT
jgi:hypothetical protein